MLLQSAEAVPPEYYAQLATDADPLISCLIRVGQAISTGSDVVQPLCDLLDLGHVRSMIWAMRYVRDLPSDQATRIYTHLIDAVEGDPRGQDERAARAMEAVRRLFEINSQAVIDRLAGAPDDGILQETILIGLYESQSPLAGEAARKVRRIGSGRADSIALVLIAKHDAALPPQELAALGRIASGGGRVSDTLQTQAAWLYVKQKNAIDSALAKVFAE
jgi:hypothetical protein